MELCVCVCLDRYSLSEVYMYMCVYMLSEY